MQTLVYGVVNVDKGTTDKPLVKATLAQISPTVALITHSGAPIELGDNVSIAATSNRTNNGWVYAVQKKSVAPAWPVSHEWGCSLTIAYSGDSVSILEYALDYSTNNPPNQTTITDNDVSPTTRLGVVAIPPSGIQWRRLLVWQTASKGSLKCRLIPGQEGRAICYGIEILRN